MKICCRFLWLSLFFIIGVATIYAKIFSLKIQDDPSASSYEIQWIQNKENLEELFREDVETLPGKSVVLSEPKAPYFRIRGKNSLNQPGPWSEIFKSEDFLKEEITLSLDEESGIKEIEEETPFIPEMALLFAGNELYLKDGLVVFPKDLRGEIWLSLNGGEKFRYQEEFRLEHNRLYTLELEYRNSRGKILNKESYRFKTDLLPPRTYRFIFFPAFGGKNQLYLTPRSKILFFPLETNSGLEATFCRFSEEEDFAPCGPVLTLPEKYQKPCRSCIKFQYYSLDKAGNKEKTKEEVLGFIF